jgi:hypothetical protein
VHLLCDSRLTLTRRPQQEEAEAENLKKEIARLEAQLQAAS